MCSVTTVITQYRHDLKKNFACLCTLEGRTMAPLKFPPFYRNFLDMAKLGRTYLCGDFLIVIKTNELRVQREPIKGRRCF